MRLLATLPAAGAPGAGRISGCGRPRRDRPLPAGRDGVLDAMLAAAPEAATELGDHRFDDRLTDLSAGRRRRSACDDAAATRSPRWTRSTTRGSTPTTGSTWRSCAPRSPATCGSRRSCARTRPDPLLHLPGDGALPAAGRARSASRRSGCGRSRPGCGGAGAARRSPASVLHDMPRVHVETAIAQAPRRRRAARRGARRAAGAGARAGRRGRPGPDRGAATRSREHARWLEGAAAGQRRRPAAGRAGLRRPALVHPGHRDRPGRAAHPGRERPAGGRGGDRRARRADLPAARPRPGQVREVLDRLAAEAPVDRRHDAAAVPAALADAHRPGPRAGPGHACRTMPVEIIVMPRVAARRRGRLLRPAGPAGAAGRGRRALPTLFAVSPTPADWDAERGGVVLPRVQRPHAAQPHGARGDAGARAAARARAGLPRRHAGAGGAPQRPVHRGLGGVRRGAGGRRPGWATEPAVDGRRCGCSS